MAKPAPNVASAPYGGDALNEDHDVKRILGRYPQPPFLAEESQELEQFYQARNQLHNSKYEELPFLNRCSLLLILITLLAVIAFVISISLGEWYVTTSTAFTGENTTNKTGLWRFCVNDECEGISSDRLQGQLSEGMPCNRTTSEIAARYYSIRGLLLGALLLQVLSVLLAVAVNLRPTRTTFVSVIALMSLIAITIGAVGIIMFMLTYGTWVWCDKEFCVLQIGWASSCNASIGYAVYIGCGALGLTGCSFIASLVMRLSMSNVKKAAVVESRQLLRALKAKWEIRINAKAEIQAQKEAQAEANAKAAQQKEMEKAAATAAINEVAEGEDGDGGWTVDPNTGYYFNAESNMFYDPDTEMYFDIAEGQWVRFSD